MYSQNISKLSRLFFPLFSLILYVVMWNNKKICRFAFAYEGRQLRYLRRFQLLNLYNFVGMWMKYDWTGCEIITIGEFRNPQRKICLFAALSFINLTWNDLGSNTCLQSYRRWLIAWATHVRWAYHTIFVEVTYMTKKTSRHITTLFIVNMIRSNKQLFHYPSFEDVSKHSPE